MTKSQLPWNLCFLLAAMMASSTTFAAENPNYTYFKASLAFPWFMFLVFALLILIPFLLVVFLAWRKPRKTGDSQQLDHSEQ